ncbi:hypothetical protein O1L55_00025 [Streptomyces albulus]|nr:hypothetical protein [Streptomyces noursei]
MTSLTGMCAGTPQVIVPGAEMLAGAARALAEYGAALTLPTGDDTPEALGRACRRMLADDARAGAPRPCVKRSRPCPRPPPPSGCWRT